MGSIVEEAKFVDAEHTDRSKAAVGVPLSLLEPGELETVLSHQVGRTVPNRMWLVGSDRKVVSMVDPDDFSSTRGDQSWIGVASTRILTGAVHVIVLESPNSGRVDRETFLKSALPDGIRERLFPSSAESTVA